MDRYKATPDNEVKFYNMMCEDGNQFSKMKEQLGEFAAVLFYLRNFEKWLIKKKEVSNVPDREATNCDAS
jgi:hypothetical protein